MSTEAQKRASKKYYESHKEYYRNYQNNYLKGMRKELKELKELSKQKMGQIINLETAKKLSDYDKLELKITNLKLLLANEFNNNDKIIKKLDKSRNKEQLLVLKTRNLFCIEILKILE